MSPDEHQRANKDAKIYVGRSTTVHNGMFCCHTLEMSYVACTFLLLGSLGRSKPLLCSVHGQGQKCEQKPTTKNFFGFRKHCPLLTMKDRSKGEPIATPMYLIIKHTLIK